MGEQIDLRAFLVCFQRIIDDWLNRGGGDVGVRHGIGGKVVVRDEKMVVEKIPEPCLVSIACYSPDQPWEYDHMESPAPGREYAVVALAPPLTAFHLAISVLFSQ